MELTMLYSFTIIFDFMTITFLNLNREYVFIVYSYAIGLIIILNVMKASKVIIAISEGRGFLFYDPIYVLLFIMIIYGLPKVYE